MDGDEKQKYMDAGDEGAWLYATFLMSASSKGWNVPDYPKVVKIGFSGILKEIDEERRTMKMVDEASWDKSIFLEAMAIELKAAIAYANRYAVLADELGAGAKGKRRDELLFIAEIFEC